jgi:hypothetical protein
MDNLLKRAKEYGVVTNLSSPLNMPEVLRLIDEMVANKRGGENVS